MNGHILASITLLGFVGTLAFFTPPAGQAEDQPAKTEQTESEISMVTLPLPKLDGATSVEKALAERRSIRTYRDEPLTLAEVSQILWAAQGISDSTSGKRTAPSARAMYFLDVYLFAGNVTGLAQGMYRYQPQDHLLATVMPGDAKTKLFEAAGQAPIEKAPAALVIAGESDRSTNSSWMYLEAGHAAENVYLQGVSLGIGTVVMAGFKPDEVKKALSLPENQTVIYIMPLGRKP
jgi:SagB-type dehydrogenase family enzyme